MTALQITPTGAYDVISGAALIVLAATILWAGFGKRVNQIFFLFLFLRGGWSILLGLTKSSATIREATFFAYSSVHFELPLLAATLALAALFPRPTRFARSPLFWLAMLGVTLSLEAWYVLQHEAFVMGVIGPQWFGAWARTNGNGAHIFYAGILIAQAILLWRFAQSYANPASPISREQAKYVLAGTIATTAHNFGFGVAALPIFVHRGYALTEPGAIVQSIGAIVGLTVGGFLLGRMMRRGDQDRKDLRLLGGVFALAAVAGLVDAVVFGAGLANALYWNSGALWRLVAAGFFAYGILRYQLFDIDIRLKKLVPRGLQVGGSAALFTVVSFGLLNVLGSGPSGIVTSQLVAGAAVLLALAPLGTVGRELAERAFPGDLRSPAYVLDRKLAVYRAALEGALEGTDTLTPADQALLRKLRLELGLTEREHAIMEYAVRQANRRERETVASDLGPGSLLLGRYRVERLLGEGTSGRTYLATSGANAPAVALKHVRRDISSGLERKILQEAKILAAVRHPNVVMLLDVEQAGDDVFIVMEYADGGSLKDRLTEGGPLPLPEACAVLRDLLQGLQAIHEHGIVHRDVKPANLLLTTSGGAKVADFGLALSDAAPDATIGGLGTVGASAGTPAYMSPEQARGSAVDRRTDLYAAAAVFYEALTGRTYLDFTGLSEFEMRGAILAEAPDLALADHPAWVRDFLHRSLEKDPGRRFQTADEMLATLRAGAGQLLTPA